MAGIRPSFSTYWTTGSTVAHLMRALFLRSSEATRLHIAQLCILGPEQGGSTVTSLRWVPHLHFMCISIVANAVVNCNCKVQVSCPLLST